MTPFSLQQTGLALHIYYAQAFWKLQYKVDKQTVVFNLKI